MDCIAWTINPQTGLRNPKRVPDRRYAVRMGRPPKDPAPKDATHAVFIDRVTHLVATAFPKAIRDTDRYEQLAKRAGIAAETVRRAMKGQTSPTLETMDAIARALGESVSSLLSHTPNPRIAPPPDGKGDEAELHRHRR